MSTIRFDHVEIYEAADDVTLASLRVTRGSRFDGGKESPGTIDFSILDPDATYTPRNTASPLYPWVNAGRKVHIRATRDGRLYGIAYGIVSSVTPDPDTKSVSFTCGDGLSELDQYTVSRSFATTLSYREARAAALSEEALGTAQHSLATDSLEASPFIDGTDAETSLLDYLDELNEATGSIHYCAPHVEAVRPWRYVTVTRPTLTDARTGTTIDEDFQRLSDVDARDESLITRQRVTWVGYEYRGSQVVAEATSAVPYLVYTDELYGSTDYPEPEDVFALKRVRARRSATAGACAAWAASGWMRWFRSRSRARGRRTPRSSTGWCPWRTSRPASPTPSASQRPLP